MDLPLWAFVVTVLFVVGLGGLLLSNWILMRRSKPLGAGNKPRRLNVELSQMSEIVGQAMKAKRGPRDAATQVVARKNDQGVQTEQDTKGAEAKRIMKGVADQAATGQQVESRERRPKSPTRRTEMSDVGDAVRKLLPAGTPEWKITEVAHQAEMFCGPTEAEDKRGTLAQRFRQWLRGARSLNPSLFGDRKNL